MQSPTRHEVYRASEQLRELICQLLDIPSEPTARAQSVKDIDVAVALDVVTSRRSENEQLSHTILLTYGSQASLVYDRAGNGQHALRLPVRVGQALHIGAE